MAQSASRKILDHTISCVRAASVGITFGAPLMVLAWLLTYILALKIDANSWPTFFFLFLVFSAVAACLIGVVLIGLGLPIYILWWNFKFKEKWIVVTLGVLIALTFSVWLNNPLHPIMLGDRQPILCDVMCPPPPPVSVADWVIALSKIALQTGVGGGITILMMTMALREQSAPSSLSHRD